MNKLGEIMEERDFVGVDVCFVCGEPKGVLLDRRLKKSLPRKAVYNDEPCDKCKEIMKKGVIFIGVRDGEQDRKNPYRTGHFIGIKEEAIRKMIKEPLLSKILKKRLCYVEKSVLVKLGLVDKEGKLLMKKE